MLLHRSNFLKIEKSGGAYLDKQLKTRALMQSIHIAVPKSLQVIDLVMRCIVCHAKTQFARQVTLGNTHLPKSIIVGLFCPTETYMTILFTLYDMSRERVVVCPRLSPSE